MPVSGKIQEQQNATASLATKARGQSLVIVETIHRVPSASATKIALRATATIAGKKLTALQRELAVLEREVNAL